MINLITKQSRGGGVTGSVYATAASAGLKRTGLNLGYNSKTLAITASLAANYQHNKNHAVDERDGLDPISDEFLKNFDEGLAPQSHPRDHLGAGEPCTYTPDATRISSPAALSYSDLLVHGHPDDFYTNDGPDGAPVEIFDYRGLRRFLETANSVSAGWRHTFGEGHELSVDAVYNDAIQRDNTLYTTTPILPAADAKTVPAPADARNDGNVHHSEESCAPSTAAERGGRRAQGRLRAAPRGQRRQLRRLHGPDGGDPGPRGGPGQPLPLQPVP